MREIKFRAKYKDANGWTYSNPNRMSVFWKDEEDEFFIEGTITQFTGLKDKNGKEIYEGDVIRVFFSAYAPNDIHIIKWQECSAQFVGEMVEKNKHSEYHQSRIINLYQEQNCEIIGNIYENPELAPNPDLKGDA